MSRLLWEQTLGSRKQKTSGELCVVKSELLSSCPERLSPIFCLKSTLTSLRTQDPKALPCQAILRA